MYARLTAVTLALSLALGPIGPNLATPQAVAADEPRTVQTILPPSLNPNVANFGNLFSQCGYGSLVNPTVNAVAQAFKKKDPANASTAISLETPCEPFSIGEGIRLECSAYEDGDGEWNSERFDKVLGIYTKAESALSCRKGKLKLIQSELECFKKGNAALEQQISQLKGEYTRNMQRMQSEITMMNTYIADRDKQIGEVQAKLLGDPATGRPGVTELKGQIKAMLDAAHETIHSPDPGKGIKARIKKAEFDRIRYKEDVKIRTMALAVDCFKTQPISSLQCVPNGPPVNAYEFAKCSTERYFKLGRDGRQERGDAEIDARAKAKSAAIVAELDRIFMNAPSDPNVPAMTQQQAEAAANQKTRYLDPQSINWSRFEQFNRKELKFDIRRTIEQSMNYCYKNSSSQVQKETKVTEKGRPGSPLAIAAKNIEAFEEATQQMTNRVVQDYELQYQKINATLTGSSVPLNTAQCKNASPSRQLGCLEDGYAALDDLLQGKTPQSEQTMFFKASNSAMNIELKCRGLVGCETALGNMKTNLDNDKGKVVANKKNYIQKANQQIEQFTEQMARNFSPQSEYLRERLEKIKGALAGLSIRDLGLSLTEMQGETLEKGREQDGSEGLYQNPKNILALIGSQAQPPMLKIDALNGPIGGVADAVDKIEDQEKSISSARMTLAGLETSCKRTAAKEKIEALRNAGRELANCYQNLQYGCQESQKAQLNELRNSIENVSNEIGTSIGGSFIDLSAILAGAVGACEGANRRLDREIEVKRQEMEAAQDQIVVLKDNLFRLESAQTAKPSGSADETAAARTTLATSIQAKESEVRKLAQEIASKGMTGETGPSCLASNGSFGKELQDVRNKGRALGSSGSGR